MNIPISYNWLRAHFEKDIPHPDELAVLFTKHLAEVEGMERRGDDTIFDIKILPDRGHDLLSHRGIAREAAVLSGVPLKTSRKSKIKSLKASTTALRVVVKDAEICPRYIGCRVENITVGSSPVWIRERLESVGQRSINNIVDITNYVMLELGQPMHAFDSDNLAGTEIIVRPATEGETMTTLDDRAIALTPETLVIADRERVHAIAGVKGGKDAGVSEATTSIVFEAANFNPVHVRKTSQRVGIRTDSSRRFEHGLSPSLADEAMILALKLLLEVCPRATVGGIVDVYPRPEQEQMISITVAELNGILGTPLAADAIEHIIKRLNFTYTRDGDLFTVTPPLVRLDLAIKEDLAEEIGRIYGLDNIPDTPLPDIPFVPHPLKAYYYANRIRDAFVREGFSEVLTSSFQKEGVFAVENPLAEDKGFVRNNLATGLGQALALNVRNAPLLGLDDIKIFEIGTAFPGVKDERLSCAVGIELTKAGEKKESTTREALEHARGVIEEAIGVSVEGVFTANIFEFDLGALLDKLSKPKIGTPFTSTSTRYVKISPYPFILRDIALLVPEEVTSKEVLDVIVREAGDLLRTKRLFDVFTKELPEGKKTSYAYNLVFQSYEKTLSDEEINGIMERIGAAVAKKGWQVR